MADVAARYLGLAVDRRCPCGQLFQLRCVEIIDRLCQECGELHQDAIFIGACQRCEQVHEQRAIITEDDA